MLFACDVSGGGVSGWGVEKADIVQPVRATAPTTIAAEATISLVAFLLLPEKVGIALYCLPNKDLIPPPAIAVSSEQRDSFRTK